MNKTIDEVRQHRPKMNYAGFNQQTWTTVEVMDRNAGSWQWGQGLYFDWCDDHCIADYNIVKYSRSTVLGRFQNPKDAVMFKLRWS